MLTVAEAAKKLELSEGRTRALIKSGKLKAQKKGRQWMVSERSVENRLNQDVHAGRPRKPSKTCSDEGMTNSFKPDQAYSLYLSCRDQVSQGGISELILSARTTEERDFYVCLFNFFLEKKCTELVEAGAY